MGGGRLVAMGFVLALALDGLPSCAGSPAGPRRPDARSEPVVTTSSPAARACTGAGLGLSYEPSVFFQATGDRGIAFRLRNLGAGACRLIGYPKVALLDRAGIALPFRYTDGHNAYITRRRPVAITLTPGGTVYVGVAKYRCDVGGRGLAIRIVMTLPGGGPALSTSLSGRALSISYCLGGPRDPGNSVGISPFEARAGSVQF